MNQSIPEQLLEACRGLAACELGPNVGGHVSIRVPGEERYYTHAFNRTFGEIEMDDVVLLDFAGRPVGSNRSPSIGIGFHHGIYKQRPDVNAIVHTHGFWITAQAAFARPPRIFNNVSTIFHGRTAISPNDDFDAIGPVLKPTDVAIVIPWHGAITVGRNVGEAVAFQVVLDYTARMDVTLPAHTPTFPADQCQEICDLVLRANYYHETWEVVRRKVNGRHKPAMVTPAAAF